MREIIQPPGAVRRGTVEEVVGSGTGSGTGGEVWGESEKSGGQGYLVWV